jgi:electron transfer flavoprotein beta subunit
MKVLVAIKRVLDPNVKVRVRTDGLDVDLGGAKMAINPFCETALEQAVRLKESDVVSEVVVVSVGTLAAQEQLRVALAIGADRAILVESDTQEPLNIAKLLGAIARQEQPGLLLSGKQSIDQENSQVGQMLAGILDWPQAINVFQLDVTGQEFVVTQEVDGATRKLALSVPALVTCDLRLNEPRYALLPNIMKAKKKPLQVLSPEKLGITLRAHSRLLAVEEPVARPAGVRVESVDALVNQLRHEQGII